MKFKILMALSLGFIIASPPSQAAPKETVCTEIYKNCESFCVEHHKEEDDAENCAHQCQAVFGKDGHCTANQKLFNCKIDDVDLDRDECLLNCEEQNASNILFCLNKFKTDGPDRKNCYEAAEAIWADKTGPCKELCGTEPLAAYCEEK